MSKTYNEWKTVEEKSFAFWAEKAKIKTARSFLDSGGVYGYNSDAELPMSGLTLDLYKGDAESLTISTIHLLSKFTDPNDEIAQATDELLAWFGAFAMDDSWPATMESFIPWLHLMLEHTISLELDYLDEDGWHLDFGWPMVAFNMGIDDDYKINDAIILMPALSYIVELTKAFLDADDYRGRYGDEEADEFPWRALVEIYWHANVHAGDIEWKGIVNTYNQDTDLSRVLQYGIIGLGDWNVVLVQLHNGCDVRGGYTRPYAALVEMDDYYNLVARTDFWCGNCDTSYYTQYDLSQAYSKAGFSFVWAWDQAYEEDEYYTSMLNGIMGAEDGVDLQDMPRLQEQLKIRLKINEIMRKRGWKRYRRGEGQAAFWHNEYCGGELSALFKKMADPASTERLQELRNVMDVLQELWRSVTDFTAEELNIPYDFEKFTTVPAELVLLRCPECGELTLRAYAPMN